MVWETLHCEMQGPTFSTGQCLSSTIHCEFNIFPLERIMAAGDQFKKRRTLTQASNPMGSGFQPRQFTTPQRTPLNIYSGPLPVQQSPYQQYGASVPPAGASVGASMGTVSPNTAMDFKRRVGGLNYQQPSSMAPQGPRTPQPDTASTFVNPVQTGRVPMSPLASNARPQGNPFLDDQRTAMAEQGLTDRMNALTQRSQTLNPMGMAAPGQLPIDQYRDPRMDALMARENARLQNTPANPFVAEMNDPNRMTPEMKQRFGESAVGYRMAGGVAADPTNGRSRFTGDNPLAQDTAEYAENLRRVAAGEGVMIQPGGRGSNQQFIGFNNTRQGAEAAVNARRDAGGFVIRSGPLRGKAYNSPEAIAARKEFEAEKAAKHEAFKAANGGMNYAQARRANQRSDRMEGKFKKAVRQGLNPMSPQAFAMFPDQAAAARGRYQNRDGAPKNPMETGAYARGSNTVESRAASMARNVDRESSPLFAAIGVQPGGGIQSLDSGLSGWSGDVSDEMLKEIQGYALDHKEASDSDNPFTVGGAGDRTSEYRSGLWAELTSIPDDPAARRAWYEKYRAHKNAVTNPMSGAPSPSNPPPSPNMPFFPAGTPVGR